MAEKEDFYRFGVTAPIVKRVPGFEVFARQQRIVIYGKPGAGKTTFLKHCAINCAAGDFRPELIPIFVTLKHFAEHEGSPPLLAYIQRQWNGNPNTETVLRRGAHSFCWTASTKSETMISIVFERPSKKLQPTLPVAL